MVVPTSKTCQWNQPSAASVDEELVKSKVENMTFFKPKRMMDVKMNMIVHMENISRAVFDPLTAADRTLTQDTGHAEYQRRAGVFFAALRRGQGGRRSASEVQWNHLEADMKVDLPQAPQATGTKRGRAHSTGSMQLGIGSAGSHGKRRQTTGCRLNSRWQSN